MTQRRVWTNAIAVTGLNGTQGERLDIAVEGGRIVATGSGLARAGDCVIGCENCLITPAFVDCHTHLVHGGDRAREFEMRLNGASYEDIARAGGGIASSMRSTRALDADGLVQETLPRLDALLAEGTSTVEIKSGYGLDVETELKMLRAARKLETLRPVRIRTSWLAAHAMPPGYGGSKADYISNIAIAGLDAAYREGLVDAVDAFCETIAFSVEEIEPLFAHAKALGLPVRLHTGQLTHSGGALLAARYGALSADHLEHADARDAAALKAAGTVPVLLPGAFYMLRETQLPPVQILRDAGLKIALATDCNPGTSPLSSLLLTMNMAAVLFRMTVQECFEGVTVNAARALGLEHVTGRIAPGYSADFAIWRAQNVAQLVNRAGINPLHSRVFKGIITHG
ncbi:imidazolonepropionase [Acidocella sp.]|uniref:imidazolonepropionase n=1 Tax=Acidocella sp. TaxID=50710 RepID=UPI00261CFC47|nr:imidazolonepropionase [Acidocella sp.]